MKGIIYAIKNEITNEHYIGKTTKSVEERFKRHIWDSRKERNSNRKLYKAMNEFGVENFTFFTIGEYEEDELELKEVEYIRLYDSFYNGYNSTLGGDGSKTVAIPDEEFICLYKRFKSIGAVSRLTGHSTDIISMILKRNGIVIKGNNSNSPIRINETNQEFDSIRECARYLIENKITDSQNVLYVSAGILKNLSGRRTSYYGMTFCYI